MKFVLDPTRTFSSIDKGDAFIGFGYLCRCMGIQKSAEVVEIQKSKKGIVHEERA
jgi:hypothetical protein